MQRVAVADDLPVPHFGRAHLVLEGQHLIGRRQLRSNNSWMHNLPMLVRAFTYRNKGMDTMIKKAISGGCDGVVRVEVDPIYAATRN